MQRRFGPTGKPILLSSAPQRKRILFAQLRIYGLCLVLAESLMLLCTRLDFWSNQFKALGPTVTSHFLALFAYQFLSIALAMPVFQFFQIALEQRRLQKPLKAAVFSLEPYYQLFQFCALCFYVIPLSEAAMMAMGISNSNFLESRFLFRTGALCSIIPLSISMFFLAFKNTDGRRITPIGMKHDDFLFKTDFLRAKDFHLGLLDSRPDDEVNSFIEVAKHTGDLEKATQISDYLLRRHMPESSGQITIEH